MQKSTNPLIPNCSAQCTGVYCSGEVSRHILFHTYVNRITVIENVVHCTGTPVVACKRTGKQADHCKAYPHRDAHIALDPMSTVQYTCWLEVE